jgi:predicted transcriptional regulator
MAATKTKTSFERANLKARIARLRLQRKSQTEIAEAVGITQGQVSRYIKQIEQAYDASAIEDIRRVKSQAKAQFDDLIREYYEGWERSKVPHETKSLKQRPGGGKDKAKVMEEKSLRQESQVGDPRFLDGVRRCTEDIVSLYGAAAPQKIDFNDITDKPTGSLTSQLVGFLTRCGFDPAGSKQAESGGADLHGADPAGVGAETPAGDTPSE